MFLVFPCNCNTSCYLLFLVVKVTPDQTFAGILREKNTYVQAILRESTAIYIIGKVNERRFREKKCELRVSSVLQKKIASKYENDSVSFN